MKRLLIILPFLIPFIASATQNGDVFIDYYKTSTSSISVSYIMPYGPNGKYIILENKGKDVASSSLIDNTPFSQSGILKFKFDKAGFYELRALLCSDLKKTNCSTSTPISFVYKNNSIIDEAKLGESDITILRKQNIDYRNDINFAKYIKSNLTKSEKIKIASDKDYLSKENVVRAKRIISKSNLASIIESSNGYTTDDFYKLISEYPSFCNEVTSSADKDTLCGRELAAYFTTLLWYTNNNLTSEYLGMNNRDKLSELFGKKIDSGISSKEMFFLLLDYYMKDRNPEPSMHSSMTYGFLLNNYDYNNGLMVGFGTLVNIATHGKVCGGNDVKYTKSISDLYNKFLRILNIEDKGVLTCDNQKPFTIYSSSFYPQYYYSNNRTGICELNIFESNNLKSCKPNDYNQAIMKGILNQKMYVDNYVNSSSSPTIDSRILLDKNISATYSYLDSYYNESRLVPFNKINTVIYEDAYFDNNGSLKFKDNFVAFDKPFDGDCLRSDCKRGALNYLKGGKVVNKNLKIILDLEISNVLIFKNEKNINAAVSELNNFLNANNYIDGVTLTIRGVNNDFDSEYLRKLIVALKTKWAGTNTSISIRLPANSELIKFIDFKTIIPIISDVYLLAFDIHTTREKLTNHGASIITLNKDPDTVSMASLLIELKNKGIDKSKIIIGIPMFGRAWLDVKDTKKYSSTTPGLFETHNTDYNRSYVSYREIVDSFLLRGGFNYYEDKVRQASYLYDWKTFISYDSPEMVALKIKYLFNDQYKGVMLADVVSDNGDLLEKVLSEIKKGKGDSCKIERKIKSPLRFGSVGADVYALQNYLKCKGYLPSYFEINGNYGKDTMKAVSDWQVDNDLKNTGVLDVNSIIKI